MTRRLRRLAIAAALLAAWFGPLGPTFSRMLAFAQGSVPALGAVCSAGRSASGGDQPGDRAPYDLCPLCISHALTSAPPPLPFTWTQMQPRVASIAAGPAASPAFASHWPAAPSRAPPQLA